jgi:DNA-binding response OmpR family regulator
MADVRILLVDDDVELCALLSEYLGGQGYRVSGVHDGASGLRAALTQEHDLVILDVMLPILNGFDLLRQLRRRSNVPVIMLTARAGETDRVQGFHDGVDDYLVKPFAAAELLGRVRRLAAHRRRSTGAATSQHMGRAYPRRGTAGGFLERTFHRFDAHRIRGSRHADPIRRASRVARRADRGTAPTRGHAL